MKSYRFEIIYESDGIKALMVNIPIGSIADGDESMASKCREWIKREKGINCTRARFKGYSFTKEDIIEARRKERIKSKIKS